MHCTVQVHIVYDFVGTQVRIAPHAVPLACRLYWGNPSDETTITEVPRQNRCGTINISSCSNAIDRCQA